MNTQAYSDDDYMNSHHFDEESFREHHTRCVCCSPEEECGWEGLLEDCVYCGSVGPLCPDCHEVVETCL